MQQARTDNVVRLECNAAHCGECRLQHLCIMQVAEGGHAGTCLARHTRPLARGHNLFRQGERLQSLYILHSGSVKSSVCTPDGLEHVVRFHLPGDLLGVDALGEGTHSSTAQCLETSTVCSVPVHIIEDAEQRYPGLNARILKHAAREIAREHARAVMLAQRGADERLAAFLLQLSEAYGRLGYATHAFNLPMARQDIASYLALAVETVSRLFTAFQREGLVKVDRRSIVIPSRPRLHEVASRHDDAPRITAAG